MIDHQKSSFMQAAANPNKTLYKGGSEWQNDFSNLPDYYMTANRNYDAALGRFIGVDPMAETTESMTSYQYAGNNPIMYNDPLGDYPIPQHDPYIYGNGGGYIHRGSGNGLADVPGDNDYGEQGYNQIGFGGIPVFYRYIGPDGINIYHAGDGTPKDPSTGLTLNELQGLLANVNYITVTPNGISYFTKGSYQQNPNWNPQDAGSTKLGNLQYDVVAPKNYFISFGQIESALMDNLASRTQTPDLIAINLSTTKAGPLGGWNQTVQFNLITRGPEKGFFVTSSQTTGNRYGAEISISLTLVSGWYLGGVDDITRSSLEGNGFDVSMDVAVGLDLWDGRSKPSFFQLPEWVGYGVSIGPAIGASAGFSNTTIVK